VSEAAVTRAAPRLHAAMPAGAWRTVRRGIELSPELTRGIGLTLVLAVVSTAGRIVVPIAVQQTLDRGITSPAGPRPGLVAVLAGACALALAVTSVAGYVTNLRIFRATEAGLATLRTKAFRHVHDLSVLTQASQLRGSLVARVTTDVDTISTFVQWGGLLLVVSTGQLLVATVVMAVYSWQLALLVWACFLPVFLLTRRLQVLVSRAYAEVRERVGDMLATISESVVGAEVIRAFAIQDRSQRRIEERIEAHKGAAVRAQLLVAGSFSGGILVSGLVVAVVVVVGARMGIAGHLSLGELLAVLFLVQLFTGPVQVGTEVLNELQNAVAGWRRVMGVLDTPADVADPGADGVRLQPAAAQKLARWQATGHGHLPVCMAKTQNSLSDDAKKIGRPRGFTITVRDARLSAGAGFVVVYAGDVLTMPGLPKVPGAEGMDVDAAGEITGLF